VVAAVCRAVAALERILVPVSSKAASERAVELACRLGAEQKAHIILAYIIEVPFTLALDARMSDEEKKGEEALHTARLIVEQHGLPVRTKIVPHRYAAAGILQQAKEEGVDAIVLSSAPARLGSGEGLGRTIDEVLRRATCEVILDRISCRPAAILAARPEARAAVG
jgi:nucleotide-binding universal stress UspA family protein